MAVAKRRELYQDWQAATETETLVNAFKNFSEGVREIILQAKDAKCWGLYDMEDLTTWSKGCAALLGDAAHPFQPCKSSFLSICFCIIRLIM
jgi:salicylate hydroxylase